MRVNAVDGDEGINDDILYSITGGNLRINGTPSFSIDASSGWITVNVPSLDREEHNSYVLEITVRLQLFSLHQRSFEPYGVTRVWE